MIRFEIINDTLCSMVEPEPLTDNTKYPCIMTRKYRSPSAMDYLNEYMVIGYPVLDGSAEWALYQMMQGKWVYNPSLEKHKSDKLDTRYLHAYGKFGQDIVVKNTLTGIDSILGAANISHWTNYAEPSGWQLYEPESLLADAKVGDLCKTDLDEWIQIDDISEPPSPILYHFDRPFNGNIIHTEPLAPEGTDKWAWQMMLLGKKVCQKHNSYFPNKRYYAIKDGNDYCAFYENNGNEVNITNTRRTYDEFIEYCKFTPQYNWQLYTEPQTEPCEICAGIGMISCEACNATGRVSIEPEPKPAYAVGDWVEYFDNAELCHAQIDEIDSDYCTINPVVGWDRTLQRIRITCITRKLQPSEVIVTIGCLGGIVRSSYYTDGTLLTDEFILYRDDVKNAIIAKAMLDEPTAKLVKELLEKQGEGK